MSIQVMVDDQKTGISEKNIACIRKDELKQENDVQKESIVEYIKGTPYVPVDILLDYMIDTKGRLEEIQKSALETGQYIGFEQKLKEIVEKKVNKYFSKIFFAIKEILNFAKQTEGIKIEKIRAQVNPEVEDINLFFAIRAENFKKSNHFGIGLGDIKRKCFSERGFMPEIHYVNIKDKACIDYDLIAADFPVILKPR